MGDADLLRTALREETAFDAIYRRHAPRLYRRLVGDVPREVALDLVAETFAQVLISLHRFRGETDAAAAAWLNGIARHLLQDYLRRERIQDRARRKLEVQEAIATALAEAQAGSDTDLVRLEEAVDAAFAELPLGLREALQLRVVDELPYDEVARQLEIEPEAARMRVSRGLRTLSDRLRGAGR
jgi:RNA polymerase sigma factor (sigma-70 family)